MADLRIVDAPVLLQESITDDVKMPTGGLGNFSIRLGDIVWYVVQKKQLANKNYVDTSSKGVQDKLDNHIANKANPHQVTKAQVGLGNVDNTADIDKPVSSAVNSAIITATTDMATKAYVNQQGNLKADKATTLSGYGIVDTYTKDEADTKINSVSGGYFAAFDTLANLQASTGAKTGQVAKVMSDPTATNNGDYRYTGSAWVKGYDVLTDAKNYTDGLETSRQLTNATSFTVDGYYINKSTGLVVAEPTYQCTDFIQVEPNVVYSYSLLLATIPGGVFYDENKLYISGFGTPQNTAQFTVTTPANARYVRLSNAKSYATPYFKADGRYNIGKVLNITNSFKPVNNLARQPFLASAFNIADTFVNITNGNIDSDTRFSRTDYIAVEPNINYEVLAVGLGNAGAVWYDADKKYISGFSPNTVTTVTAPSNARYIVISVLKANLATVYFKTVDERLSISKVTNIVNAFPPITPAKNVTVGTANLEQKLTSIDSPMFGETVVKSKSELLAVNNNGTSDKAYPIGRRVYDQSLRSEVYADGSFWRLPDGTPASLAPRTYVFPDWDEIRVALPTYAVAYKKIFDAKTLTGWGKNVVNSGLNYSLSTKYGFDSIYIEQSNNTASYVYFNNGGVITLNTYLIFKAAIDFTTLDQVEVCLFDINGQKLFNKFLSPNELGGNGRNFYSGVDIVRVELRISDMSAVNGASLSSVAGIGFGASRKAGQIIKMWIGELETVSFKPMITLRFDDQRLSVYQNAYPVMDNYGFKGMIAVITGRPNLGNDPDINYGSINADGMTKEQLIEIRNKGWDLVSHTHTHADYDTKSDEYMRADYQKSVDYLRKELGASELSSSVLVSPFNKRNERIAQIQRKYFDAQLNQFGYNSHMPRQPEGTWDKGSLWTDLLSQVGDGNTADTLIGYAQQAIAKQRWVSVMMHDILPIPTNSTNINVNDFVAFMDWLNANRNLIDVVTITDVVKKIRPNG